MVIYFIIDFFYYFNEKTENLIKYLIYSLQVNILDEKDYHYLHQL